MVEKANEGRDGKLVTGGGRGEEEEERRKTRQQMGKQDGETSVSDGSTETGRLSGRYKN